MMTQLTQKFVHWWNGYSTVNALSGKTTQKLAWTENTRDQNKHRPRIPFRARVLQELWGEGNLTPGSEEFVRTLTRPLGLSPEMNMLDLGAGLGGPARAISKAYGVWVTAYEDVQEIAEAGMEQSTICGMSKRVPITCVNFETVERPKRKFDCFFSKETIHRIRGKAHFLSAMETALKPRGSFLITDFVKTGNAKDSPRITEWNDVEKKERASQFWTRENYITGFDKANLEIRVTEDITSEYMKFITDGFNGLNNKIDSLIRENLDPDDQAGMLHALAFESKRWEIRTNALQSGDIAIMRFSGIAMAHPPSR